MGLIEEIVEQSGLPEDLIRREFISYIKQKGFDPDIVGMEEIQFVLFQYLQEVLFGAELTLNQSEL